MVALGHHKIHLRPGPVRRHLHLVQFMLQLLNPRLLLDTGLVLRCVGQQVVGMPVAARV